MKTKNLQPTLMEPAHGKSANGRKANALGYSVVQNRWFVNLGSLK